MKTPEVMVGDTAIEEVNVAAGRLGAEGVFVVGYVGSRTQTAKIWLSKDTCMEIVEIVDPPGDREPLPFLWPWER